MYTEFENMICIVAGFFTVNTIIILYQIIKYLLDKQKKEEKHECEYTRDRKIHIITLIGLYILYICLLVKKSIVGYNMLLDIVNLFPLVWIVQLLLKDVICEDGIFTYKQYILWSDIKSIKSISNNRCRIYLINGREIELGASETVIKSYNYTK